MNRKVDDRLTKGLDTRIGSLQEEQNYKFSAATYSFWSDAVADAREKMQEKTLVTPACCNTNNRIHKDQQGGVGGAKDKYPRVSKPTQM